MSSGTQTPMLFPEVGALVHSRGGELFLIDAAAGWTSRVSGELAADLLEALDGGPVSARLAGLSATMPVVAAALRWFASKSAPLSGESALALGGFGTLFVELVGRCNERCLHCYASSGPEVQGKLERSEVEAALVDAAELGFERIQFTGGDPLLCDFLPDLAAAVGAHGIDICEIYTNGLALGDRLMAELAPHRPSFAFSFYSHRSEVHDAITQTPGSCKRTLAAIERALRAKCPVRVAIVVTEKNADDVEATMAVLKEAGVKLVTVSGSYAVGRGHLTAVPSTSSSFQSSSHVGTASSSRNGRLCISYTGDVLPCIFNRGRSLGNIRDSSLLDIVRGPKRRRELATMSQLLAESLSQLSCSECRLTNAALHLVGAQ